MARIERPDSTIAQITDLMRRVRELETISAVGAGVLNRVAQSDTTQNQNYVLTTGTDNDMTMDVLQTWQVDRRSRFLILAVANGHNSGASGNFAYMKYSVRSGPTSASEIDVFGNALWDKANPGYLGALLYRYIDVTQFPVTLQIRPVAFGDTGQTLFHYFCHIDVYALGA